MKLFDQTEINSMEEFAEKYKGCYKNNNPNNRPMGFAITSRSAGIGSQIRITCECCGETFDASNYDLW